MAELEQKAIPAPPLLTNAEILAVIERSQSSHMPLNLVDLLSAEGKAEIAKRLLRERGRDIEAMRAELTRITELEELANVGRDDEVGLV